MKLVIYTAIFGDFDTLRTPKIINSDVKYVCLSDKKIEKTPPWEIRIIKPEFEDLRRENRKYKILSHRLFENFDYSIYLDGNYLINCDLSQYIEKWLGKNNIAFFRHPQRNCLYQEAKACIKSKLYNKKIIKKQMKRYKKDIYPKNNGLTHNSFIIRRHTQSIKEFNELWWNEVKNYSERDQLSCCYVMHKLKINYSIIPIPSPLKRHSEYLERISHNINDKWKKKKPFIRIREQIRKIPYIDDVWYRIKKRFKKFRSSL